MSSSFLRRSFYSSYLSFFFLFRNFNRMWLYIIYLKYYIILICVCVCVLYLWNSIKKFIEHMRVSYIKNVYYVMLLFIYLFFKICSCSCCYSCCLLNKYWKNFSLSLYSFNVIFLVSPQTSFFFLETTIKNK